MTHTINRSQHKTTTPTGLYEANYRRLIRLVPELRQLSVNERHSLFSSEITILVLEQYKYTTVVSIKQSLQLSISKDEINQNNRPSTDVKKFHPMTHLNSIDMELRICHDACLVEVIGYQGKSPVQSALVYPNKHMLQIDEKRQLNLFLKDVLENSLKTEYYLKQSLS
ncbi:MAG: DUF1249 domain-containing protein [Gammaproteobacteria bacterium]|nr:DUF1249 domain-containing protein [Gammaproteobacteria bacterium]